MFAPENSDELILPKKEEFEGNIPQARESRLLEFRKNITRLEAGLEIADGEIDQESETATAIDSRATGDWSRSCESDHATLSIKQGHGHKLLDLVREVIDINTVPKTETKE